jgi:hypothetical protein
MKNTISRVLLIGLGASWLAACGSSGSHDSPPGTPDSGLSAGNGTCINRNSAVGIEGGGIRRVLGEISSIGGDGTLVVDCVRVSAGEAEIIINGIAGNISDLDVGDVVEVVGSTDPESGTLRADSISSKVVNAQASHGRYVGTVRIGDGQFFGDALLTEDGAIRLYVGGPYVASGALQATRPSGSSQLVGTFQVSGDRATGNGVIIGQGCSNPLVASRFCGAGAGGELALNVTADEVGGQIHLTTSEGSETWVLDLQAWRNYYLMSAAPQYVAGQYQEQLGEFVTGDDTVINVGGGELSFQSANSGCTGNGTLSPHLGGKFNVYDVTLTIGNCGSQYAYLNGQFEGLATTTPGGYWDYDSWLRIWMSKQEPGQPATAVTMLGQPIY